MLPVSDIRMHVASTSVNRLVDYAMNTPEDSFTTGGSAKTRIELIRNNQKLARKK